MKMSYEYKKEMLEQMLDEATLFWYSREGHEWFKFSVQNGEPKMLVYNIKNQLHHLKARDAFMKKVRSYNGDISRVELEAMYGKLCIRVKEKRMQVTYEGTAISSQFKTLIGKYANIS